MLASLLAPESSQYAVRTALEIFTAYRNQSAFPVLLDMFEDPLGLSEGLTSECNTVSPVSADDMRVLKPFVAVSQESAI